ncbi:DUF3616 domain-containing protein [Kineosporia sp. NBRC 101731]|uniref:DUF3616 domain-containing protein n=1 Tax=Kineosporia sp. NBRC 101731 TaxID=3032199 RepID=UPI0024A1BC4E|nr:DUF3616 domain-containing protein [Kineosporia sp. NBRC 101731]GLY29825.1 hypothetical protein Kisp02_31900 [Kineosporia sp. NBRC 101731]
MNGWRLPERQIELVFDATAQEAGTHTNLSGIRTDGEHLWIAGDETATLERLTAVPAGSTTERYDGHRTVRLADLVELPGQDADGEADIEGLARSGDWLWAVGSHSLKRRRIKDTHPDAKARKRLAKVLREENRYTLLRLAVTTDPDGGPGLARTATSGGRRLTSAVLGGRGDSITDLLAQEHDPHLEPFLEIPGKDNGVDIEGIAAHGDRLYLGLRGPVLRGWATLLEIRPVTDPDDEHRLVLAPLENGERYRTHFLDLGGLGIRDLCPHGDDLLLLAGPSMSISGPIKVVRWRGGCVVEAADIVREDELQIVMSLPHGDGADHAEGITLLDEDHLLVVYDSPAPERLTPGGVLADVVRL